MISISSSFVFSTNVFPVNCRTKIDVFILQTRSRACFKIAFWQLCVPVCGRFVPDEGRIAGY
ncbi:DUF6783 domain-containing protein, partial [uncultured Robinsoniella sp.]|uniref:DUF6783 domain-containing protein n=1 Tax=uncultured Robinsoniella sp. TaxID=904190 RepID=UPI00374EA778